MYWAVVFISISLLAGVFAFGGFAAASAGAAEILFVVFLALGLISAAVRVYGADRD
ncbi:Small integral membrane protein [Jannaschia seosinensis]|uniref:UPF0391 membrane protein JSE7799_00920 n=1 Tax=Jannaschia seosinensis TaxID=313367 RepID=A0A0M7BA53_9RHOB|nr:Small integral membrane protein [Jannaschia seosinensis]